MRVRPAQVYQGVPVLRSVASRVLVGGLVVLGGFGGFAAAALPAGASCAPGPIMCVKPNTGITNHESLRVVVKDPASPNTEIAITECNHNLPGGDMNACDSNASDLNKPGGPALAMTDATGTAIFPAYKARVSLTKMVGDTFCSPGGDTCFILAANVSTMTQLAVPPAPFTTK